MKPLSSEKRQDSRSPAKRKIRNYLIDRGFQLRWMFRVIFIISIIVAIMGYFLYQTVADATDQMMAQKLGDVDLTADSVEAFKDQAAADKQLTLYTLLAWLLSLVGVISLTTIALTHRIAGPVYKMRKIFATINGDNLRLWERLRKGDELKEAFEDFDDMLRRLREHRREDTKLLEKIRENMVKANAEPQIIADVDKIIERYKESVRMN